MTPSFEEAVLPHLDAGRRLARWLTRNEQDADDVLQEASLRALRYFRTFTGGNARAWFLQIVRNTSWGRYQHVRAGMEPFDEEQHSSVREARDPEALMLHTHDVTVIEETLRSLPDRFRELLVLRELEGLSYRELADVMGIPLGSVMSGLSRARRALRAALEIELLQDDGPRRTQPREEEANEVLV
jgi:RNA polymerase sigma-70 factor (ECF subfamily)